MSFFKKPIIINTGGSGASFDRKRETFIATANQTVFTLTGTYEINKNKIDVLVGNVPQFSPDAYVEASTNTIRFTEGLPAGTEVIVSYFQ